MITRAEELCRKLKPVLGRKVDALWNAYLSECDAGGRAEVEQTLALLAAKHLGTNYEPDRSPFPPPSRDFATAGDLPLGAISYGNRELYPFALRSRRLKEHLLVAGRSGSGKTNLTFILMQGIMDRGIKVLALDWKRGYRDLLELHPELKVYTIGRNVAPFRFNPLIPPPGCETHVWIKNIVDVIANSYLGGEGVISLLIAGLDHLYNEASRTRRWPTVQDLLVWLRTVKLRGRAAMWQASAERILRAMQYGEFASVLNTQDNRHVLDLLNHNVILEMDGLSSSSDRVMFSESLMLYLYRYRLAQGPRDELTNIAIIEEAHNLLLAKQPGSKESVLETSIRMIRQYGLGYVFVDQSASLLSKVAFANSYATIALSQKLRADVQTMSGAMNLSDEQRDALSTLAVGTAVVRLADEHPEPFLIKVPRCKIQEGAVDDAMVRQHMRSDSTESAADLAAFPDPPPITAVPSPDKNISNGTGITHPPSPEVAVTPVRSVNMNAPAQNTHSSFQTIAHSKSDPAISHDRSPTELPLSREEIRFLADVAARPLSTTVSRYQRLHLSRRKGNAIRQSLLAAGLIEAVPIATRSGQVVLYDLTDPGRAIAQVNGLAPGSPPRAGLEHRYWVARVAEHLERQGYEITHEFHIPGDGHVDLVAEKPGERIAIEVETGKSDINANLEKLRGSGFDRIILLATTPSALSLCQKALHSCTTDQYCPVESTTWLDVV